MPYLLLAATIFFWGTTYRANAIATEHASSLMFSAFRAAPAALILLAVVPVVRARLPRGRDLLWAAGSGLVMVTLVLEAISEGVTRAGAGNAAVLVNTSPFFVLVLARIFLGERPSWVGIGGLVLGFAGVVVMVSSQLGGAADAGQLALGMTAALVAAAAWGSGTLFVKWLVQRDPALDLLGLTIGQFLAGGIALLAIAFAVDGTGGTDWTSGEMWGSFAWAAVGSSAIGTLTYFLALKRLAATRTASWLFLIPAVAILVEVARGASPGAEAFVGMVIATAGVAIVSTAPLVASRAAPTSASASA
jgi:drug/metabolite transporter (DMT)-like permease